MMIKNLASCTFEVKTTSIFQAPASRRKSRTPG